MPQKRNPQGKIKVTITISRLTYSKLAESARANNLPVTSQAHQAVEVYLDNFEREKDSSWQSPLERRLQKMENRLAALMAKLVRVSAQSLWFSTLPFTKGGLPNKPLPEQAFQILWNNSRAFAANWLKKAQLDEEQSAITKPIMLDEPGKQ